MQGGEPPLKKLKTEVTCRDEDRTLSSPFQMLPDELVLKIFSMALFSKAPGRCPHCHFITPDLSHLEQKQRRRMLRNHLKNHHLKIKELEYLIDVLGNVSCRFRRIAGDRIFWQDPIKLDFLSQSDEDVMKNMERFKRITDCYLSKSARDVTIRGDIQSKKGMSLSNCALQAKNIFKIDISEENIITLSEKCPQLRFLRISHIRLPQWPSEQDAWVRLRELTLSFTESPYTFVGVQLHHVAPNLHTFRIKEDGCPPIILPDMTKCHNLLDVELIGGGHQSFSFPKSFREKLPFPRYMRRLTIMMIDFTEGGARLDTIEVLSAIKKISTKCKISYEFFQDIATICSGAL